MTLNLNAVLNDKRTQKDLEQAQNNLTNQMINNACKMNAPDRIYTNPSFSIRNYLKEKSGSWQTEYIRADKVNAALEQLKGIQAYIEATNSDNSFLMGKVLAAIKHLKA